MQNPQVHWHAVPAASLAWREWDGEVVVFNQQTGSTHLLGELAGEVLRRLVVAAPGATVETLARELNADPGSIEAADWIATVYEVLSDFARLGLAQPDMS